MDAVGEHHAAVVARTFEAAEMAANHVHLAKLAGLNRVAQPQRRRIKTQNMADLQNAFCLVASSGELLGFVVASVSGFSTNTSLPASSNSLHSGKCDCAGVTMTTPSTWLMSVLVIRREPLGGQAEFARGFKLFVADLGDVKLDGHRIKIAQMVRAPAAQT
jgi:hypothetical protein